MRLSAFTNVVGSGSFLASNSETVSISTIGPVASGSVLISHNATGTHRIPLAGGSSPDVKAEAVDGYVRCAFLPSLWLSG